MDLGYFLRQRTSLIRLFYDKARVPFEQLKRDIEEEVPPWEPPFFDPDTDSGEPPYLVEWIQAEQTRELVGLLSVSLLSDTLKLYFHELERHFGIRWQDEKARKNHFKQGVVEAYRQIIEHVMGEEFRTCPVRFDVIEQVILARNDFAHNDNFLSFQTRHNAKTLEKHPNPFFVGREDNETASASWGNFQLEVSREALMAAIAEVEKLADWVQHNDNVVWEWRRRMQRQEER
ncbi:hypothetical protein NBH19_21885 [Rhizobium sp. S95]|uniref:Uncharacterized protein n=1 Tax=Ciceribacter sichuanensis TaxID=2949647 RepID=A0AAJ1BXA2_9HYPH|nr:MULTISPECIES: hypothetical protein [unclassified Ciceribacter]MCM2398734.1 hypothetical protein [Ciceribacter sp. S95]MCO5957060.1 hypothetical protein [Ciceribacter sp. S101]